MVTFYYRNCPPAPVSSSSQTSVVAALGHVLAAPFYERSVDLRLVVDVSIPHFASKELRSLLACAFGEELESRGLRQVLDIVVQPESGNPQANDHVDCVPPNPPRRQCAAV